MTDPKTLSLYQQRIIAICAKEFNMDILNAGNMLMFLGVQMMYAQYETERKVRSQLQSDLYLIEEMAWNAFHNNAEQRKSNKD